MVNPHNEIVCTYKKGMKFSVNWYTVIFKIYILLSKQRKVQKHVYHIILLFFQTLPCHSLLALESRKGLCFLGWRINQLIDFSFSLRIASSECPYSPFRTRVAIRTAVYWTCILWPAASYNCKMVWKTSAISCYSTSRTNRWSSISQNEKLASVSLK